MNSQVVSRRNFFKLFGAAAVVAPLAPKYFFAPIGGWRPFVIPENGLFPSGKYKIEGGCPMFFLPRTYSMQFSMSTADREVWGKIVERYKVDQDKYITGAIYGYKG